jgi:hypothetical protein
LVPARADWLALTGMRSGALARGWLGGAALARPGAASSVSVMAWAMRSAARSGCFAVQTADDGFDGRDEGLVRGPLRPPGTAGRSDTGWDEITVPID